MSIFSEIKSMISVRQVAESYGLKVNRNGMACCPFHNDRNPSMKIDASHYYCFGCGVHGDVIGYVAELFCVSQYDAACKIIQDFSLSIEVDSKHQVSEGERKAKQKMVEQKKYAEKVKKKFQKWADETIDQLKSCQRIINEAKRSLISENPGAVFISNGFAYILHQQSKIEYWLDILCIGKEEEKHQLFLIDGKEVKRVAANVQRAGDEVLGRNRECVG